MSTQIEVAQVVAMIGSAYPNFTASKETVGVYYELLKDLPVELLRVSALQCCAETGRKFAPSVGEIRGAAASIRNKANGIPSALSAWDEVCNAPKSGENVRVTDERNEQGAVIIEKIKYTWSHPLVERVATMLGFPDFPKPDNESVDRAHFFKQYEAELLRATNDDIELPEVAGYITNSQIKQLAEGMKK